MTAQASPRVAHALPQKSGKPCRDRPGMFKSALVLLYYFYIALQERPPGMPWP